jgi:inhibitor of cysteine peptidase
MMEILIRLLMALLYVIGAAMTAQPPTDSEPTIRSYTNILDVDVAVLESFPVQLRLTIKGEQPDGCDYPVVVEQERDGEIVTVDIYRNVPMGVMCPMILITYNETFSLEGGFEAGTYTISVNGYMVEVKI